MVFSGQAFIYASTSIQIFRSSSKFVYWFQSILVIFLTGAFAGMVWASRGFTPWIVRFYWVLLGRMVLFLSSESWGLFSLLWWSRGRAGSRDDSWNRNHAKYRTDRCSETDGLTPFVTLSSLDSWRVSFPFLCSRPFSMWWHFRGYLIGVRLLGVGVGNYLERWRIMWRWKTFWKESINLSASGCWITWVCCYKGYYTGFGAEGSAKQRPRLSSFHPS